MEFLIAIGAVVVALIALSRQSGLDARIAQLKLKVGTLEDELLRLRNALRSGPEQEGKVIDLVRKVAAPEAQQQPGSVPGQVPAAAEAVQSPVTPEQVTEAAALPSQKLEW